MGKIDRILRAVEARPWAIQPEKMEEIAQILAARAEAGSFPSADEVAALEGAQAARQQRTVGGSSKGAIAVMQLFGTISRRMGMLDAMSGGSSVETFSKAFDEAMADDAIGTILIVIDSPGGSVYGVEELFQKIHAARDQKRIIAVADSLAASAAYYIGCAASEFVVTPSGEVGSIGVYMVHFDWSRAIDAEGVTPTIIKAGEHKAEGNPYEPLEADTVEHFQALINDFYGQFLAAVAKGRGVSVKEVKEQFGQGRTFTAKRALQRGMVDRIATVDDVLAELTGQKRRREMKRADGGVLEVAASLVDAAAASARSLAVDAGPYEAGLPLRRAYEALTDKLYLEHPDNETPSDAAGQASQGKHPAPTEPAPEAREETMSGKDTAAPTAGLSDAERQAAMEEARTAERERVRQIRGICSEHSIDAETADRWINGSFTADQARETANEIVRARAAHTPDIRVTGDREAEKPFLSLGEFLLATRAAEGPQRRVDKRLLALNDRYAAATGASEAVPSDGGFLVQPEIAADILKRTYELGAVASRVRRRPVGPNSNGLKLKAIDETSRANGSRYGGIQAYWADEADTVTSTKPKFRTMELSLSKLMAIMYSTEELLQDAVALQGIAEDAFAEEIVFKVEDAVFRGTGAGQPLGFLNSSALVTVAKESGQTAATINATNVLKMFARLWPRSRMNAAWFVNVDAEPQLPLMTIGDQPIYLPPGGLRDNPYGTLLGRPVIPVEYAQTVGTVGDISLVDLDQYLVIDKGEPMSAWSIHVRFIYDEQTFKITYRCDGQPLWNQPLTPFKGTNTLSPFVVLATRS